MFLFERVFDEFLCASIVEEKNGMALSVMSAFARRNVDPRQEAASCQGIRDPGIVRDDRRVAALLTQPSEPPSDNGTPDGGSAPLRRFRSFAAQDLAGRVALSRRETVRGAVVLLFLLVVTAFVALGLQSKSVHPVLPPTSDAGSAK